MSSRITRRRLLGVPFALSVVSLAACGGGSDDENTGHSNVRLLNLTSDLASVDLWVDETRWFAAAATDALTDYIEVDDDTFELELRSAGDSSTLLSSEQGFGEDLHYTLNALTLSIDYGVVASDVALGSASSFASLTANDSARVDVTAANSSAAVYSATDVNLQAQGVYTLFVLGGSATPTGVLRKDK